MARLKTMGNGRGMTAVFGMVRLSVSARAFREGLRDGLKRRGETDQGDFREVRLASAHWGVFGEATRTNAPPDDARGLCVVLPGGLRIEGLDVAGAASLARLLG